MPTREEVIERMAEAIYNAYWPPNPGFLGARPLPWSLVSEWHKDVARRQAKAVLALMQTVADEMGIP